jgi:hypothetical protein
MSATVQLLTIAVVVCDDRRNRLVPPKGVMCMIGWCESIVCVRRGIGVRQCMRRLRCGCQSCCGRVVVWCDRDGNAARVVFSFGGNVCEARRRTWHAHPPLLGKRFHKWFAFLVYNGHRVTTKRMPLAWCAMEMVGMFRVMWHVQGRYQRLERCPPVHGTGNGVVVGGSHCGPMDPWLACVRGSQYPLVPLNLRQWMMVDDGTLVWLPWLPMDPTRRGRANHRC